MHSNHPHSGPMADPEESYFFREDLDQKGKALRQALRHWPIWGIAAIAGMLLGLAYYFIKPVTYTARTSFVVEDSKGAGGMLSALAGQFNFDIGALSGASSGILAGDNVLELLKSRSLIKKTLLTKMDSATAETLADRYASSKGWKQKWAKSKKVGFEVNFASGAPKSRVTDSLLQRIVKEIVEEDLAVAKPDRKLGFFEMNVTMQDESLALHFSKRLLKAATDFYIDTRTQRLATNVARLQGKADTLERMLNRKTYSAAASNKMLLDLNPIFTAPDAVAEISSREKMMQSTIYAEIIKNLEISKTALIQETPTVQVVDEPELPLKEKQTTLPVLMISGFLLGALISLVFLMSTGKSKP